MLFILEIIRNKSSKFIYVRTNLIARVSRIHGHEIHVVSYACLDGDCRLYEADYVVYILMRPPPD